MILAGGCASLPDAHQILKAEASHRTTPRIVTAQGPLSRAQSKAVLHGLARAAQSTELLQRHLGFEEAVTGTPLVAGNKVTLLENGPATYQAVFQAVQYARDHINLESYLIEDDTLGNQLAGLLIERAAAGVQVNLIYDSVGSLGTPAAFFQRLEQAGVRVIEFNPVDPLKARRAWSLTHRDHRKLLVVDGAIAITGGVNVSAVYSRGSLSRPELGSREQDNKHGALPWRDTDVRIEGPVVAEFQRIFPETWASQHGAPLPPRNYFPSLTPKGKAIVRVIASTPDKPLSLMYVTLLSAITHAERSVHLTTAYFVPDHQMRETLQAAAKRGVDVTLILPSRSDFWPALAAGRSHYKDLLEAGVKIYERRGALLHAKTAVIDGVWSTVGSTNLDWLSFVYNNEINAVVLGTEIGEAMEAMFTKDLADSVRIDPEQWRKRPFSVRVREWIAGLWEQLL